MRYYSQNPSCFGRCRVNTQIHSSFGRSIITLRITVFLVCAVLPSESQIVSVQCRTFLSILVVSVSAVLPSESMQFFSIGLSSESKIVCLMKCPESQGPWLVQYYSQNHRFMVSEVLPSGSQVSWTVQYNFQNHSSFVQ